MVKGGLEPGRHMRELLLDNAQHPPCHLPLQRRKPHAVQRALLLRVEVDSAIKN